MSDSSWDYVSIGDCLSSVFSGEWGDEARGGGNATVLRSTDIDDDGHIVGAGVVRQVPPDKLSWKKLLPGDILLEASGGSPTNPVGRVALVRTTVHGPLICSNFFRTLRPVPNKVQPDYLTYQLLRLHASSTIWHFQQQTTGIINLKIQDYLKASVPLPPLQEQQQIGTILKCIDSEIRHTEELVAKLKLVKQGLVHDLLTRGIDDNGELRDPDRRPEQFQDSPLGRIPKRWIAAQLGGVVPRATYGGSEALTTGPGIPVLRMNNIKDGEAHLEDLKYSDHPCYRGLLLRDGDVLFNRTNSIEHVGRTGIWRGQITTASFASYLVKLDPDPVQLRGEFLNRVLNWDIIQLRIRRYATPGVHQVNINPTNLRKTLVALPNSLEEQDRITQLLAAEDGRIRAEVMVLARISHHG